MRQLILLFIFIPTIVFSQKKDYKTYDKAVKYFNEGKNEKAKKLIVKILDKNADWSQPNLLMASIFANEGNIKESVLFLLNVYDVNTPDHAKGIEQIANLYYSNGYYTNALYYFNISRSLDISVLDKKTILKIKNCQFSIKKINNPVVFNPKNLGKNINTEFEEYLPALSVDGNTFVFTKRVSKEGYALQEDFYISTRSKGEDWKEAFAYPGAINTTKNEGAFSFSANKEQVVYTACDRDDGQGRCDLYLMLNNITYNAGKIINTKHWESQGCFSPDGKYLYFVSNRPGGYGGKDIWRSEITKYGFLPAVNLGDTINTKYDEMSPFVHPDNLTFYFASDGQIGFGDYDLFVSRRSNTTKEWGLPKNMGYPINTHNTENSLIVAANGKTAYYVSDVSGFGKEDIFQFELPEDLQAEELADLEINIITKKIGEEIVLKNVQFDHNSYVLKTSSFTELHKLIIYLHKNNSLKISVEGHTDNIGNSKDNKLLSENRAKSVYDYLLVKGVSPNQLVSYSGYGEKKPISDNETKSGRALNRRTSFRIIR